MKRIIEAAMKKVENNETSYRRVKVTKIVKGKYGFYAFGGVRFEDGSEEKVYLPVVPEDFKKGVYYIHERDINYKRGKYTVCQRNLCSPEKLKREISSLKIDYSNKLIAEVNGVYAIWSLDELLEEISASKELADKFVELIELSKKLKKIYSTIYFDIDVNVILEEAVENKIKEIKKELKEQEEHFNRLKEFFEKFYKGNDIVVVTKDAPWYSRHMGRTYGGVAKRELIIPANLGDLSPEEEQEFWDKIWWEEKYEADVTKFYQDLEKEFLLRYKEEVEKKKEEEERIKRYEALFKEPEYQKALEVFEEKGPEAAMVYMLNIVNSNVGSELWAAVYKFGPEAKKVWDYVNDELPHMRARKEWWRNRAKELGLDV